MVRLHLMRPSPIPRSKWLVRNCSSEVHTDRDSLTTEFHGVGIILGFGLFHRYGLFRHNFQCEWNWDQDNKIGFIILHGSFHTAT